MKQAWELHHADAGGVIIEAAIAIPLLLGALYALLLMGLGMVQAAESSSFAMRLMLNYYSTPIDTGVGVNHIHQMVINSDPSIAGDIAAHIQERNYLDPGDDAHLHLLNLLSGEVGRAAWSYFMRDHQNRERGWYTHLEVASISGNSDRVRVSVYNSAISHLAPYTELTVRRGRALSP